MRAASPPNPLTSLRRELHALGNPVRAASSSRFFKTGPGEYGEGDQFLGLSVPQVRALLPATDALSEPDLLSLLCSEWHEERLLALFILVRRFGKMKRDEAGQKHLVDLYLANTRWINNWDLVDTSAPHILGVWLLQRDRRVLKRLAASSSLWEQRIAVLATQTFIREGDFNDTLQLCETFLGHRHDLMHKACGWMLREIGKRELSVLRTFLNSHAPRMPRTMLRYAIEKLSEKERRHYLSSTSK
ncbi:MAG: DNA alkylation repair protein [Verrucomicrobiales bacterium]|nr:DNA alkylation repair protein [Verrucomicrobiales bacterium]